MTLPDHRWSELRRHFDDLVEAPSGEQAATLARLAAEDPALGEELATLLAAERTAGDRFERAPDLPNAPGDGEEPDAEAGLRIGPYRISREVGRGGMGAVYEAFRDDGTFAKRVAIKMVPVERVTPAVLRRFHHERQILARLEHRNIAALLDGGVTDDGRPWFAMEFVEGERIDRYSDQRQLGIRERLALVRQVCSAVQYAHQNLVIHRDLKPGNVLVGPDGTVKLLDFGIAKLVEPGELEPDLTDTGVLPMTTGYASPEQIRGEPVTTATDIYSLAVVAYELVAGRAPFPSAGVPATEFRRRVLEDTPPAPSSVAGPARAPIAALGRARARELDQILLMALRKEPARRYASVEQFAEDLQRLLAGRPVRAQPDSVGYRTRKFAARNPALVGALAVTFLVLAGGLAVTRWQVQVSRDAQRRSEVVNRFLHDVLIASATDTRSPEGQRTLGEALDAATRRLDSPELAGFPDVRAAVQQVIGTSYLALGRYDQGETHLRAALATQRALLGDTHPATLETRTALARLALVRAEYDSASAFFSMHLPDLQRAVEAGAIPARSLLVALNDYGLLRRARGDAEAAESLFRAGLALAPRLGADALGDLTQLETLLALVLLDRGKLGEAERQARRLVAEGAGGPDSASASMAAAYTILGSILMELGRLDEAASLLRDGEALYRRLFDGDFVATHDNLRLQAQVALLAGRLDEGEVLIERVLANYRRFSSERYISFATALTVRGLLHHARGRTAEAEAVLREAVRLRRENLPPGHFMTALSEGALGEVLAAAGRTTEADTLLRASYSALLRSQAEDNPRVQAARERLARLQAAP